MKIVLIAAVGQRRELGKNGELIWSIPADLARFKLLTDGHPVIMGRKTYDSLPEVARPLPGRINIVLSRRAVADERVHDTVYGVDSVQEALSVASQSDGGDLCYICGGAEIYRQFLPYADMLELTMIEERDADADTYFPRWERSDFNEVTRESQQESGLTYHFVRYEKKK